MDYAYFKDNHRLIAVDLSKQKALNADPRAIQQIVIQGAVGGEDNMKIRTVHYSWKIERINARIFPKEQQKYCNYIWKVEYGKVNVKLSDAQLKKLKTAVKDKIEATNILLKGVSKTIKNETKKQEEGF